MGARKHNSAEAMKAARKEQYFAKANNIPTSPRKMRLVADMVRGLEVNRALGALHFSTREASRALEKLLKSAIANWEVKTGKKAEAVCRSSVCFPLLRVVLIVSASVATTLQYL